MAARQQGGPASAGGKLSIEVAHYYARIYGAARSACLGELRRAGCAEEEAEDIFAATFERIMRKLDPASEGFGPAQTVALLKQACRQKLIDERRHRGVVRVLPLGDASERSDLTSESPAETAEDREAVAIGREAISSLPGRDRRIFLQRHRLGLSPEEILRRNPGLSPRTYRKLMQRANARALAAFEEIGSGARCAEMRREQLRRYVAEEASDAEQRAIRDHLRHCRGCGIEVARMRGRLHEVAAGLAVLLAGEGPSSARLGDLPARMLDAAGGGGEALIGATRALRERLRELAIRMTGGLPGSGGEGAVGQIAGISAAKAASVCAAGALTVSCLAAGLVPGGSGLGLAGPGPGDHRSQPKRSPVPPLRPSAPAGVPPAPAPSSTARSPERESTTGSRPKRVARSIPRAPKTSSARPTISGQVTGTELGAEAAGAGVPAPTYSSGAGGTSTPSTGSGVGGTRSTNEPEFGF